MHVKRTPPGRGPTTAGRVASTRSRRLLTVARELTGLVVAVGAAGAAGLRNGVYGSWRSGPCRSPNWRVLSIWTPALWVPLNGVTVLPHPALAAVFGELNQSPT